ncbi:prolyl oligopeptidase family serine peptidase [candidate division KSB1 bacterium]|nr:prolyl oligopeptidase family serine peptidase [candidate division KSB1 bacterium]
MSLFRYAAAVCLLLFLFSIVRADYDTLIQHYRAGKIDSAIAEANALFLESPESSHYMYWLADLYSLQNQPDSSALWLERAAEHGFTEYIAILHDRDFENALRSPRFRRAVHKVKKKLLKDNRQKASSLQENRMTSYIDQGIQLRYLVIHGTKDRAVPIRETDAFIDTLQQHGYRIEYHRVKGGGHGNFSTQERVLEWLKQK